MFKFIFVICFTILISGCVAGSSNPINSLVVSEKNDKTADLEYTSTGITSDFVFKDIISGTYKDISSSIGFIAHNGSRTLTLTTKGVKSWDVSVRSEKKSYMPYGNITITMDKPYVATIKENNKRIGDIVLGIDEGVNSKNSIAKTVGLDVLMNTNFKFLDSKAIILGKTYTIKSVYKDLKGNVNSNPIAYEVYSGKSKVGLVQVDKNAFGGRTMSIWIKGGQSKIQEQSVATILTVVGYASLPL